MRIVHITLEQAQEFIGRGEGRRHRHHDAPVGHRFSLGLVDGEHLAGVACVGRPVAQALRPLQEVGLEVNRLCTDGTRNACSWLYGQAARAARELGYAWIITYTLDEEGGASLRAAGWWGECRAGSDRDDGWSSRENRKRGLGKLKWRWLKMLADVPERQVAPAGDANQGQLDLAGVAA